MIKYLFGLCIIVYSSAVFSQDVNLEWVNTHGSESSDFSYSMAIDSENNIYSTGSFMDNLDIDPGSEVNELVSNGMSDIYIQKTTGEGALLWAHSIGGISNDAGYHINVDGNDEAYIIGNFSDSIDVDPSENEHYLYSDGESNLFVLKLNSTGDFLWAVHLKTPNYVYGYASSFDENNNFYMTGNFSDSLQFGDSEEHTLFAVGFFDIFVARFTPEGELENTFSIGGTGQNAGNGIDIDLDGNIVLGGYFEDSLDFDPGPEVNMHYAQGIFDGYVLKLTSEGEFIWVKTIKGISFVNGYTMSTGPTGSIYLAGNFNDSADFDPGENVHMAIAYGSQDAFLLRLDIDGNFEWVYIYGGISVETILGINIDENSNCYFAGYFGDTVNVDPNDDDNILVSNGGVDIINGKVGLDGNLEWAYSLGADGNDIGFVIKHDQDGNVYSNGYYSSTVDFDPSSDSFPSSSVGAEDIFIYKMGQLGLTIDELDKPKHYSVFPNPSKQHFTIKNLTKDTYSYKIYSINGQIVLEKDNIYQNELELSLNAPKGVYLLELISAGEKRIKKLIKN